MELSLTKADISGDWGTDSKAIHRGGFPSKYGGELSTYVDISGRNKNLKFSVLTKNQGVKNGCPE